MAHQETDRIPTLGNYGEFNKTVKHMLDIIVKITQENYGQNNIIKILSIIGL